MHIRSYVVLAFMLLECTWMLGIEKRKEIYIDFPVSISTLNTTYRDNAARLSEIVSFLESVKQDSTLELTEVSFCGSASPEGRFAFNMKLAENRRDALVRYMRKRVSLPDSIVSCPKGVIAWERLTELVDASDMPYKKEALNILRNVPEFTYNSKGVLIDSRKSQLMRFNYGRTWFYMYKHFFPKIRNASVVLVTFREKPIAKKDTTVTVETKEDTITVEQVLPDTILIAQKTDTKATQFTSSPSKPFYMAIKTNMLYDVLAVPNIGVEFYLGKNWTVVGNWMYGWWDKDRSHRYWRLYGGDLAVRWWFGKVADRKPLTGHHVGLYGQTFTYDFEWGRKGYMGGKPGGTLWEKANYAAGLEYGYSLPIANRLNFDFTLGVGYWGGKYYEYVPLDEYYVWQATKKRCWFGPTKAEISLVWLLGRGNNNRSILHNKMKGGIR